jgi:hypothetical protein
VTSRTAARVAWSAWVVTVVFMAGAVVLSGFNSPVLGGAGRTAVLVVVGITWTIAFATVGAVVASLRPANPIGWTFCSMAVVIALVAFAEEYATRGLVAAPGTLAGARVAAWFQNWAGWLVFPSVLVVLVVLFPDGRPPFPRWRAVLWAAGVLTLLLVASAVVDSRPVQSWLRLEPLHTSNLTAVPAVGPVSRWILNAAFLRLAVFAVGAVAPILRLRRSRGGERQQLLWFVYAGALLAAAGALTLVGERTHIGYWVHYVLAAGMMAIPVATGVAILRYRLYDIDRIINRTLVYTMLTVVLGGVYAGLAVGLGSVAGSSNYLVIAGSTLVVAALFRPARRRVQDFIDRRFYRRKYDAARTLEAFSARLRNEVDLDELRDHLVAVVHETMQPAQASLWLRGASR